MSKEERLQLENELLFTCSKAQAINKYIDELEESSKLSELWCKSQERVKNLEDKLNTQRKCYQNRLIKIQKENQKLKEKLDKYENPEDMTLMFMYCEEKAKDKIKELKKQLENYKKLGFKHLQDKNNNLENQQKEFILYLENEKDRLARECSQIYEDSLGKTRLVSEDIFNEVNDILQKYKSIIGDKEVSE